MNPRVRNRPNLDRFFRPKSVAVVGGTEAARVVEQLDLLGYEGEIWPIHPVRETIEGRICLRHISELPGAPDAAFIGVPRDVAAGVVAELANAGCGGAVVYASGFGEAGELELESRLIEAAEEMPILGPNTHGYINALDGTAIWPDLHGLGPLDSGVALITQSGNIGINLTMARRSLDIAMLVTAGNQADVDIPTLMESFLDDPRITAIGLQLESIEDPMAFGHAALRAANQEVPIVALKMGTSAQGALVTASHTGALAGEDDVYGALFEFYGIARVRSIPTFLETLKLTGVIGWRPRVISLSASGGEAAHVADLASTYDVELPDLTPDHAEAVLRTAHPLMAVSNPMDYHTISWGDGSALETTFRALTKGPFDVAMLVLDFPEEPVPQEWWTTAQAFAQATHDMPGLVVSSLPEAIPPNIQDQLSALNLKPMLGLVETIEAIGALGTRRMPDVVHHAPRVFGESTTHDEAMSKGILSEAGLDVPDGSVTAAPEDSQTLYPLTIKIIGTDHKKRVGGVTVGVPDSESLVRAIASMPDATRYLIEETVSGILAELLVSLRSTDLGWLLTIGNGGTHVEEFDDRSHLLMPATHGDIAGNIDRLRVGPSLQKSGADVAALHEVVAKLWALVRRDKTLVEVEINPIALRTEGAVVLDAMLTVTQGPIT